MTSARLDRRFAVGLGAFAAVLSGCDPRATDATYWDRRAVSDESTDDAAAATGGGGAPPATSDAAATVTGAGSTTGGAEPGVVVRFETVSYGGEYATDHVGAAWIARPDGSFVRTLETWGSERLENVVAWREATGENEVDAITGATRRQHGVHELTWDRMDATRAPVAEGDLVLHLEFTEDDSAEGRPPGPHRTVPFAVGPSAVDVSAPDEESFRGVVVDVTP